MVLQTERLVVRPWTDDPTELARLVDLYAQPEVVRFLGPFRGPPAKVVDDWSRRMSENPTHIVAAIEVRDTGGIAGTLLYKPLPGEHHMEVGWHLHPDSWGHGYATEAGRAAIDRGFRLGVPEVFAVVRPDNPRSRAVCRRLGMRHLGRTGRYYDLELDLFHLPAPLRGSFHVPAPPRG